MDTIGFDIHWKPASPESAHYIQWIEKADTIYRQWVYEKKSSRPYARNEFQDAGLRVRHGSFVRWNEEGQLIDSMHYFQNKINYWLHYYPDARHKKNETSFEWLPQFHIRDTHAWLENGLEATRDTFYYDRTFRLSLPDTATLMEVLSYEDSVWQTLTYTKDSLKLISKRFYKDRNYQIPTRYYCYYINHQIRDSMLFDSTGKQTELWKFHRNGLLSSVQYYRTAEKSKNRNWDESGKSIPVDTKVHPAVPRENFKSWQRKLIRNMNQDDRIPWERRKNWYGSVYISFLVTDEGQMKDVFIKQASLYPEMNALILAYCKEENSWEPCRVWGRRENFMGTHSFTFVAGKLIRYETMY
ncbi:MAG TPA: hypothetical protein PKK69_03875 [Ferruginibacter sp.]|nr:hypothetical protein [Ferruginibacter sp.]